MKTFFFFSSTVIWHFIWKRIKIARHESRSFVSWHEGTFHWNASFHCPVLYVFALRRSRGAARATRSRSFHERLSSRPVRFSSRLRRITGANWISRRILKASPAGDSRFKQNQILRILFLFLIFERKYLLVWTILDQFHSRGSDFFFFFNCRIQSDSRRYYNTFVNNDYTIP